MALSPADIAAIESVLTGQPEPTLAVGDLRRGFPRLSVTTCDASDVDLEPPFRSWRHVSLYLVDSTDHCWRLTSDAERATGLVVVAHQAVP